MENSNFLFSAPIAALSLKYWDFLYFVLIGLAGFLSVTGYPSDSFLASSRHSPGLKLLSGLLQLLWVVSEVSLETPLWKLTSHLLPLQGSSIFLKLIPVIAMVGMSTVLHQINSLRNRILRRPSSSDTSTNPSLALGEIQAIQSQTWNNTEFNVSRANIIDDSSPHDSFSSDSSGDLSAGLPSPTGFYKDDQYIGLEKAYIAAMSSKEKYDDALYLYKYEILCEEEGMECLFVHKKLSPIKTRIEDNRQANYRPLLRSLIQQSKDKYHNIPAVRSVAKDNMEGIRMLPHKVG